MAVVIRTLRATLPYLSFVCLSTGPTPLPIFGNLLSVAREDSVTFRAFHKLTKRYGPIVQLWMGGKKCVVISGKDELKVIAKRQEQFSLLD